MFTQTGGLWAALVLLAGPAAAEPLLSPQEVAARLGDPEVVVLDIRSAGAEGPAPFETARVPGAVNADYRAAGWRVARDGVPGMLPPVAQAEALIRGLGVDAGDHVVIANVGAGENGVDMGAATRVYWTFKVLGHDRVSIMEGGMRAWEAAGLPLEDGAAAAPAPGDFSAAFRPDLYATASDVALALTEPSALLLDGRPAVQFRGEAKSGVVARAGALPGAANYPVQSMLTDGGGRFAEADVIAATLSRIEAEAGAPTAVAYCNTGHWASLAWFAASEIAGHEGVAVYDGSMAEWTADPERPATPGGAPAL